ncbi:MAG: hypothetical protein ABIA21_03650 [Candidatus Aenigmatarchaeota archaeon]
MKIDQHIKAYEEYMKNVKEISMTRGLLESQRTIGLSASRGIVELLSAYLHSIQKLDAGAQLNHRWFKSDRIVDKLPDFPGKKEILKEMILLENLSEDLTYGTEKDISAIVKTVELFNKLEKKLLGLIK